MAAVLKRKKMPAHMAQVYVIDKETWERMGGVQKQQELEISGYKMQIESLKETVASQDKTIKGQSSALAASVKALEDQKDRYETEIRHLFDQKRVLEERLKIELRRSGDAISAFDSVARAADSTAIVSHRLARFFDSLDLSDLDIVIKPKEGKKR